MLEQFQVKGDGLLVQIKTTSHTVELSSPKARLVRVVPYHLGLKAREAEKEEIAKMLAMKVIKRKRGEWNSPIIFVTNKD